MQVQDMIAGGENRARWTDEDGEKALEAIHAQRTINEVVKHHRNNQQAHGSGSAHSKAARNNEDAETEDALNAGSSEADAVARLAAAEAAKCGYTRRQYRTRCRQFRKVRLRTPPLAQSLGKLNYDSSNLVSPLKTLRSCCVR